jgi:hypothetical protein
MKNPVVFLPKGEKPTQEEIEKCKARQKKADGWNASMRRDNIRSCLIIVSLIVLGGIYLGDWKWSDFDISFNVLEFLLFVAVIVAFLIIGGYLLEKLKDYLGER